MAEVAKKYNGDDMNSVISRYEVKYCISFDTYHKLMNSINEYLVRDKYYYETIYNLYFDNDIMFMNDGYIMEIKTYNGIPIWLKDILDSLDIYPITYSKVGEIISEVY